MPFVWTVRGALLSCFLSSIHLTVPGSQGTLYLVLWPQRWVFSRSCSCLSCHCTVLCNLGCPQAKVAGEKREQNNQIHPPPPQLHPGPCAFPTTLAKSMVFFWRFSLPLLLPCRSPTGIVFKPGLRKKKEVVSLHRDILQQPLSLVFWPEGRGLFSSFCCPLFSGFYLPM